MKNNLEWVLKDNKKRDIVLILPGGGYERCSPREGMPVAVKINDADMHAAIFWYRNEKLKYPEIKDEGLEIIKEMKKNPYVKKIYILGFSAGAHYALMLSISTNLIDKTILAYPVISSDPKIRHEGSIRNLLGSLDSKWIDEVSLEKQIHQVMNPVFIMHTADDQTVPVENSLGLVQALNHYDIPFELHIYPSGRHGFSLGTKEVSFEDMDPLLFEQEFKSVAGWFDLAIQFMKRSMTHD